MKQHPGTSGLMPVKGSGCGIRPNVEEMEDSEGFDFSAAADMLDDSEDVTEVTKDRLPLQPEHVQSRRPGSDSADQSSPESQE